MNEPIKIFMVAGEASGDVLGASLMRGLKLQKPDAIFEGIGGDAMQAEGLESLIPMKDICVMGIFEIALHLSRLLKLIHGTVEEIEKRQPDVFISIDLPDFNFQVAKRLKQRGIFKGKIIHYVAPTVWAWRPRRAKKISTFLDGLMCLFPFEPEYFKPHGLSAAYVGHPLIEDAVERQGDAFKKHHEIADDAFVFGVYFGSREREVRAHGMVFKDVIEFLKAQYPNMVVVAPTTPDMEYHVHNVVSEIDCECVVASSANEKWAAMDACDLALGVSGTVGLELAYMNIPHVIAYKTNPLTWVLVRLLVKVKYAHLANILLDRDAVPECLQGQCKPVPIIKSLMGLQKNEDIRDKQKNDFEELRAKLRANISSPSKNSAEYVLSQLGK